MSDSQSLVGQTIIGVFVEADGSGIEFYTLTGVLVYETVGGCCSNSWIESVDGADLIGATIRSVEEVQISAAYDPPDHYEYIQVYSWKLTSDKGYTDIVYRNSSNGYYGGWLQLVENRKYAKGG